MTEVTWFPTDPERFGAMRRALDETLGDLTLSGVQRVTAEIARGTAVLADSARDAQDPRLWLASTARLSTLVAALSGSGSGSGSTGPRSDDDGPGGSGGGAGDVSDELAGILGAGPEMGDPAFS